MKPYLLIIFLGIVIVIMGYFLTVKSSQDKGEIRRLKSEKERLQSDSLRMRYAIDVIIKQAGKVKDELDSMKQEFTKMKASEKAREARIQAIKPKPYKTTQIDSILRKRYNY